MPRLVPGVAFVAVLTWLVVTPFAVLVPRTIAFSPFTIRGAFVPLAAGGVLLAMTLLLAWWRRAGDRVVAFAAGLFAAWLALALQVALNGTPFGFGGLGGDQGRMSAAVTRYMVTPWPSDGIVEGVTSEYPPLFPWLVGRTALLVGVPAWQLLPLAQILLTSFAVLVAFLMWQRLVPAPVALACSAVGLLVFAHPNKAFSVTMLFVFVPWLIASFANPPRGRLHWLPAGVIGGLIILTYYGWFPFGVIGVFIILVTAWRRAEDRKRYVLHVLGVGITAIVIATPYLWPYGRAMLTQGGGQTVSDLYQSFEIPDNGFPFLDSTLLGALQLVGLAGLVWYRQRTWWAWPLLYLFIGSYLFWVIMGVRYVLNEHTMLIHYVPRLTGITLAAAGVLTLAFGAPALARRLDIVAPYRFGAAVVAVTLLWIGFTYWHDWRPRPTLGSTETSAVLADYSTLAHLERLPDCTYPLYPPERRPCLPVNEIRDAVESSLGEGARPVTLSFSEQLFSFLPWRGYMGVDRTSANSLVHWDDRYAEVIKLTQVRDPAEFARQSANTPFGPIDVFVLAPGEGGTWNFIDRSFTPEQFDRSQWTIVDDLSQPLIVAIRKT